MVEEPLGALIYGYDEAQAKALEAYVRREFGVEAVLMCASGLEELRLLDILEREPWGRFEARAAKVFMMLAFDEKMIQQALRTFPKEALGRPIYCTPTENNMGWPFSKLIEELMAEDRYWKAQNEQKKA